jgi:hypothetical protein
MHITKIIAGKITLSVLKKVNRWLNSPKKPQIPAGIRM